MTKKKLVPPDGGWGWVIMFAYALNNIVFIPIMQSFGLIFKDTFAMMGLSATDGAIIITSNAAAAMIMGLVNGPLLNRFSYRKVSFAGAIIIVIGIISTAFATKFEHFVITYGVITSIGMGVGMSSFPLAMNSYFVKNRSKATGFALTITGLGPILMPQLISLLLTLYSVQGAMLIVGAIAAHGLVAACLLQPVEWHMKVELIEEEEAVENEENEKRDEIKKEESHVALLENGNTRENYKKNLRRRSSIVDSNMSIDHDAETQSIYGYDAIPTIRKPSISDTVSGSRRRSASTSDRHSEPIKNKWWSSSTSVNSVHLGSSVKIFDERERDKIIETIDESQEETPTKCNERPLISPVYNPELSVKNEEKSRLTKILSNIVNFFDLSLLQDPRYVNIMIGVSLAIFAELNFSLLTPFILADIGLGTQEIATFLSVLSIVDLIFRFISPFVGDYFDATARVMYMISLAMLIVTRFTLLMFSEFGALLGVAAGLGIAKGVRTVYMTLVIPNYVPIERLASASGLQMMVNGFLILAGGPVLGVIRDATGSYAKCIYVMNMMTLSTLIMWTMEMIYLRIKERKRQTPTEEKG
ncbi:hypothetical protein ILUMI_01822 [Ignelater luminosus]|uniref:Major facilitator superfamily (MFS) profile domain-containing protein n=1 Tax=Ignelater luminosus TaxID=2038154 RepID=A0A8K0GLD3_IGNLU|nr:hypothetical protein ILUMI_01822 [Ignelater luminosus]